MIICPSMCKTRVKVGSGEEMGGDALKHVQSKWGGWKREINCDVLIPISFPFCSLSLGGTRAVHCWVLVGPSHSSAEFVSSNVGEE